MTNEGLGPRVLPVVIVQLRLGLEALGANVTNELAVARMQLRMPLEESGFLKALVAPLEVTHKSLHRPCHIDDSGA